MTDVGLLELCAGSLARATTPKRLSAQRWGPRAPISTNARAAVTV